jgi:hypothetical protein
VRGFQLFSPRCKVSLPVILEQLITSSLSDAPYESGCSRGSREPAKSKLRSGRAGLQSHCSSSVVKALCHKPEGRGFGTRLFSIYLILPAALGPWVYSASNRNEYGNLKRIMFLGSRARPVRRADRLSKAQGLVRP